MVNCVKTSNYYKGRFENKLIIMRLVDLISLITVTSHNVTKKSHHWNSFFQQDHGICRKTKFSFYTILFCFYHRVWVCFWTAVYSAILWISIVTNCHHKVHNYLSWFVICMVMSVRTEPNWAGQCWFITVAIRSGNQTIHAVHTHNLSHNHKLYTAKYWLLAGWITTSLIL